jgi:hypothetical protein
MPFTQRFFVSGWIVTMSASCTTVPTASLPAGRSIRVDHPEIFDNAQLQSQLDTLRGQLASLGIIDTSALTGAFGTVQGTSVSQSNASVQILGKATPSIATVVPSIPGSASQGTGDTRTTTAVAVTPTVPAAPAAPSGTAALPAVASDAIGLIDKQMQLEAQLQGYQLLLGGSDFARYTIDGQAKDRVVIGFPITISPQEPHKNMAAEVEVTYFPPNANQFRQISGCGQESFRRPASPNEIRYSRDDAANATKACQEQEATPTIINLLPAERSYNVIGVASSATSLGIGAVVGTVNVGASGGWSKQTQYLVAQQDTVALQGDGTVRCISNKTDERPPTEKFTDEPRSDEIVETNPDDRFEHCIPGTRGIRFKWQFRPVLGESFVRPGRRVTFVQLAIPNVRRPYPHYGGIVYVQRTWKPFDPSAGIVKEAPPGMQNLTVDDGPSRMIKNVLGHTFIAAEVSKINATDLGGGSLLVSLQGTYLTGAVVRVGNTVLNTTSPGFIADYNSLQFVTTAQALAQSGAALISSEGVESPINLSSICKAWDAQSECTLHTAELNQHKLDIAGVSILPVSDSSSLVQVELNQESLKIADYIYYHYQRNSATGDVDQDIENREPNLADPRPMKKYRLDESLNRWPIVLTVGGKTFGLSDLPFQSIEGHDQRVFLSVVATNDSINASPQVKVQRLFGNPEDDSDWRYFVPPGRLTVALDQQWVAANGAKKKDPTGPCKPKVTCYYVISGAGVDKMKPKPLSGGAESCPGKADFDTSSFQQNSRRLKIPGCARQISLIYEAALPGQPFKGEIVLPLAGPSSSSPDATTDAVPDPGSVAPHFQMVRSVKQASESGGTASITVGIQKLKDQTATLTVQNADIVAAKDGSGNALPVQAGNKVIVTQDTNITFQVRNYLASKGVNVQAEGKNGTVSAGKVSFSVVFAIVKDAGGGGSNPPGGAGKTT